MALIRYTERYAELELFLQRMQEKDVVQTGACGDGTGSNILQSLMPYGLFKPTKLSMFGIPADLQLTARQVLELYFALSDVDPAVT